MWQQLCLVVIALVIPKVSQDNVQLGPNFAQVGPFQIYIDAGEYQAHATEKTQFTNVGPQMGEILNNHFFPGLNEYRAGLYRNAYGDLTFFIERPWALAENPNQAVYLGTAYYLRGMIFSYHASGPGRLSLAKADFENALRWNPSNYLPYLEMSRLYFRLGFRDQAIALIQQLLDLKPDDKLAEEAKGEMKRFMASREVVQETPASPDTQP